MLGVTTVFAMGALPEGAGPLMQIIPFALIFGIFYFIILLPAKKKQKKVQEFLDNLKVNDKVITTSGMYGQITRLGEQSVQVQVADKVRIEVSKAAIGGYQGQPAVVEPEKAN
jgi:preprotein translocase subunit YajC